MCCATVEIESITNIRFSFLRSLSVRKRVDKKMVIVHDNRLIIVINLSCPNSDVMCCRRRRRHQGREKIRRRWRALLCQRQRHRLLRCHFLHFTKQVPRLRSPPRCLNRGGAVQNRRGKKRERDEREEAADNSRALQGRVAPYLHLMLLPSPAAVPRGPFCSFLPSSSSSTCKSIRLIDKCRGAHLGPPNAFLLLLSSTSFWLSQAVRKSKLSIDAVPCGNGSPQARVHVTPYTFKKLGQFLQHSS